MTKPEWQNRGPVVSDSSLEFFVIMIISHSSFHILRLFAELFQFRLQRHDVARNQRVIGL